SLGPSARANPAASVGNTTASNVRRESIVITVLSSRQLSPAPAGIRNRACGAGLRIHKGF
ncbi:MAG: hypothetical protein ACRECE_05540, partial [Xanthobacteraceae bacterium]